MRREELMKVCEMRANGCTYQEIGDALGYTKQHIQQTMKEMLADHGCKISSKTVYPNLEREIKIKHRTVKKFVESNGLKYKRICDILYGKTRAYLEEAIYMSDYFGRDIGYLFDRKEISA